MEIVTDVSLYTASASAYASSTSWLICGLDESVVFSDGFSDGSDRFSDESVEFSTEWDVDSDNTVTDDLYGGNGGCISVVFVVGVASIVGVCLQSTYLSVYGLSNSILTMQKIVR